MSTTYRGAIAATSFAIIVAALAVSARSSVRASSQTVQAAELVITNGKVVTVEEGAPEAQAVAASGGKIVAVGTSAEIKQYVGPNTEVIDAKGQLVIPGFIEGHGHFNGIGTTELGLKLMNAKTWDEIVGMVAERVKTAKPGEWIYGRGWHQEKWDVRPSPNVEGFPVHDSLSKVSPNNPVLLTHASGHASFVNAKAMELSGITAATKDPEGGDLVRDAKGQPTGLLRERASGLARRGRGEPPLSAEERDARERRIIELAAKEVLSKGVTSFQDAGSSFADVDRFKAAADAGTLGVRLWVMIRQGNDALRANLAKYRMIDHANGHLTVRAIKHSIDGALGSRGAWLLEPYADKPDDAGDNTTPVETIRETAKLALEHKYQLCVHAIGDRANRETLDIFEAAFKARDGKDLRWRVEHAQHLHPTDIPRFGKLGVIASMQGIHCTSDAPYVPARLGSKRAEEGAYVWQKLMKSGALVTNGTDAPVEDVDPIASYYATVTRKLKDGSTFFPEQRMNRMEALRSYTINTARAAFEENTKGTLKAGKYADIVVISKDILTIPEDEIPTAKVTYTIVGGKVLFRR